MREAARYPFQNHNWKIKNQTDKMYKIKDCRALTEKNGIASRKIRNELLLCQRG